MGLMQGLYSSQGVLYATWKGEAGDDRLFYSQFAGAWTGQQAFGGNSSHGPAITDFGSDMVVAWKGEHSDERLFFLRIQGGVWSVQEQIPNCASSVGPTLAQFDGGVYAAWKGMEGDQAIYYSRFDGSSWSAQAQIPNVATKVGPSLAAYNGRLYAAWRGSNNDEALWFASFDGSSWSNQATIPGTASSVGPSLAVFDGRLYASWKGITGDQALWWSSFDGTSWAAQQVIPGVASSVGPALAEHGGVLYAMWKGMDSDQALYYAAFDGSQWTAQQRIPGNTGQDTPQNMGLRMQYQQTTEWCWLAVAASIGHFYGASGWITQCNLMTDIGHAINKWDPSVLCCPTSDILNAHPDLIAKMLDPFNTAAEYCLQDVGIPSMCIKSGGVGDALNVNGNNAGWRASMTLDEIAGEINAGRPVAVDISWNDGSGSHVVAIAGVLNDLLLVCDPANGDSVIGVEDFPDRYLSGAKLDGYTLTKSS